MTLQEKVGQLYMVPAYTLPGQQNYEEVMRLIKEQQIGGIIFMKGHPSIQRRWIDSFQNAAKYPLMISMDAEWGLAMRLDSTPKYPKQMTLGAVENDTLIYEMGLQIADQMRSSGVHISFSPVLDINTNAQNPVIGMRSFGSDKRRVARKSYFYMKGLQDGGVLAVGKHFPGHGDTDKDSHKDLPTLSFGKKRLYAEELYPYQHLFQNGLAGIMTAHLFIPQLDNTQNLPSSLSKKITGKLLRKDLGFKGLVFSDALSMKGVTKHFKNEQADVMAYKAGNDILLFPQNAPVSTKSILEIASSSSQELRNLNSKVLRILKAKQWMGLFKTRKPNKRKFSDGEAGFLNWRLAKGAVTIKNESNQLPIRSLGVKPAGYIQFGAGNQDFINYLGNYKKHVVLNRDLLGLTLEQLRDTLKSYEPLILSVNPPSPFSPQKNYGINQSELDEIKKLALAKPELVLTLFGPPYLLNKLPELKTTVLSYEIGKQLSSASAQIIYGAVSAKGTLPVQLDINGFSASTKPLGRMGYVPPERIGIATADLGALDSIVENAIRNQATPGCQLLLAKGSKVFYHKAYGFHTYDSIQRVQLTDNYDLASITKIAASTLLTMRYVDEKRLELDSSLGYYLGASIDSTKAGLTLKEVLAHQSGLPAWIPFYKYTLTEQGFCDSNYCYAPNSVYANQVADSLFLNREYSDTILNIINKAKLKKRGEYLYSDLGYYYLKKILDSLSSQGFEEQLANEFYHPLGVGLMYNPLRTNPKENIVPTEDDQVFRKQLIHGFVHDPGAAMLGGVAGHAGLFSNANDLAVLMQMLLNKGTYANRRYLSDDVIEAFTSQAFEGNRKGIGFDKPEPDTLKNGPTARLASHSTFGHTGFTGTATWADPENDFTFVFLSNRVHPDAGNKKLIKMNVRTDLQQKAYELIIQANEKHRQP